jgi:regulator of replication initiation timing
MKSAKLRTMKMQKNLSEMTIEELKKLIMDLITKNEHLANENKLLKAELARIKKFHPSH